jgi:hypothetical protein
MSAGGWPWQFTTANTTVVGLILQGGWHVERQRAAFSYWPGANTTYVGMQAALVEALAAGLVYSISLVHLGPVFSSSYPYGKETCVGLDCR